MDTVFETPRLRVRPWRESDAEIGYWIGKPYWNQGLGTEALRGMVDWCFNKMGFYTLWSDFFVDNPASGRIMEKSGHFFTIETFGIGAKKMYLWILNYAASLRL